MRMTAPTHSSAVAGFTASMAAHGMTPPADIVADGRIHRFSTSPKASDTAGGYVLHIDEVAAGAFWDWRTGLYVTWCDKPRDRMTGAERGAFEQRLAEQRSVAKRDRTAALRKNGKRIAAMWDASVPVTEGDPVHRYLRHRGLDLLTVPDVLRYHPALDYWHFDDKGKVVSLGQFPAMVAAVQMEAKLDGAHMPGELVTVALHRTYLTDAGTKAAVPCPKKLTGTTGDMRGAAIRLAPPAFIEGAYRLGVAEGIETALAAAEGSRVPTWAAVSASGLKHFQWPRVPHELYVFGDNDANETGQKAARDLQRNANAHGVVAHTIIPPDVGVDWADVWKARK